MDGFLTQVATDLYDRYGGELSSLHTLFPSRRAGLFFGEALSGIIDRPLWQPASITIDEVAVELSGLAVGDKLRLVAELYKIYAEFHPGESFDGFYFWGELLLGDFDSIDKYLIDPDVLFSDLVDMRELDNRFDYLEEEHRAVIARFWGSFEQRAGDREERKGGFSPEQRDFLAVWRTLAPVYHRFRARLSDLGIAYQGMVYREAAERIAGGRAPQIPRRHYVVAGFNALSKCEQVIFEYLQKNFDVDFYWDYDNYFLDDPTQEAGMFMRDNLRRFPQSRPLRGGYDNFVKPKTIRSVAAASDALQCKYAGEVLARIAREQAASPNREQAASPNRETPPGKETAIVLADESLLTPLLWSMPPEVAHINITMGYPLRMHPAYTFVERLIELQNRRRIGRSSLAFYHSDVEGLLRHPYLTTGTGGWHNSRYVYLNAARLRTSPLFDKIFTAPDGWRGMSDYLLDIIAEVCRRTTTTGTDDRAPDGGRHIEFFALISDHIRTLAISLEECAIDLSPKTYAMLLRRSLQSLTVPFEGEPLRGVQIMGILETRALDFKNIVFLSSGDDAMPGNLIGAPSFIPYNLKIAYGLPTPEHHEGVWAYHFFRLIQRAENIEMVWSSTADDRSCGEPSRYLLQLDYLSPHTVEKNTVTVDVNLSPTEAIVVEKDAKVMGRLAEFLHADTPALRHADTPVRTLSPSLFLAYVDCPLKFYFRAIARLRPDDELSEEVDNATFGNILHRAMQLLYEPLVGISDPRKQIRALIGSPAVRAAVTRAATEQYSKEEGASARDWGGSMIIAHNTIVDYIDRCILPLDASWEGGFTIEKLEDELSAPVGRVVFRGIADRIDRLSDGTLRVVDYKTGSSKNNVAAVMQMKLYAAMLRGQDVRPVLYYVRDMSKPDYRPPAIEPEPEFENEVAATLDEMFDPKIPFAQCADPRPCQWCDYNTICRR